MVGGFITITQATAYRRFEEVSIWEELVEDLEWTRDDLKGYYNDDELEKALATKT